MFNSTILDVAIGLVFTFLSISLASSALTEIIASFMKLRSTTLRAGIKDLLNDTSQHGRLTGLALALYKNALVSPRSDGQSAPPRRKLPTYIDPKHFARALMQETGIFGATMTPELLKLQIANSQFIENDGQLHTLLEEIVDRAANMTVDIQKLRDSIQDLPSTVSDDLRQILRDIVNRTDGRPGDATELRNRIKDQRDFGLRNTLGAIVDLTANTAEVTGEPAAIKARIATVVPDKQLRDLLYGVVDRTEGNMQRMEDELAHWFDSSMDRISGVYKRMTQWISLGFALVLVAVLNVSAIHVAERLWKQPIETSTIAQVNAEDIKNLKTAELFLNKLNDDEALSPSIGWQNPDAIKAFVADLFSLRFDAWTRVLGWVITALAALFGAPFWFDTLQQIIRLKGSGPSPAEKTRNMGAAA
jgi:hypothetical protein